MVVRIRLGGTRRIAVAFAAMLQPVAFVGWLLAFWRLSADLQWVRPFAISNGLFSHWQVWLGVAALLQTSIAALRRFGLASVPVFSSNNPRDSR